MFTPLISAAASLHASRAAGPSLCCLLANPPGTPRPAVVSSMGLPAFLALAPVD
jgi:hypothetical protein